MKRGFTIFTLFALLAFILLSGCVQGPSGEGLETAIDQLSREVKNETLSVEYSENTGKVYGLEGWYCLKDQSQVSLATLLSNLELSISGAEDYASFSKYEGEELEDATINISALYLLYGEDGLVSPEELGLYPAEEVFGKVYPLRSKLFSCIREEEMQKLLSLNELINTSLSDVRFYNLELEVLNTTDRGKDFGDAREDPLLEPFCGYPSLLESNGSRHLDISRAWLGFNVTSEEDAKVSDKDEDDGLLFDNGTFYIVVYNHNFDGKLYLNVLSDISKEDGCRLWDDPRDWVWRNVELNIEKGERQYIPATFPLPDDGFVRITLSSEKIENYTGEGEFKIGETEDYYFASAEEILGIDEELIIPPPEIPDLIPEPDGGPTGPSNGTDGGEGGQQGEGNESIGQQIPPKKLDNRRISGDVCNPSCGYDTSSPWGACAEKACRSCMRGSSYCSKLREAVKIYNEQVVSLAIKLNSIFDSYSKAKGSDKDRLSSQWQDLYKDYQKKLEEVRQKEKEAQQSLQEALNSCRQKASSDCKDTKDKNLAPPYDKKCIPISSEISEKFLDQFPELKKLVGDLKKSDLQKWNELKREGGAGFKFFLWKVFKELTPTSLRERAAKGEGATIDEVSYNLGVAKEEVVRGKPYLKALPKSKEDNCCDWVKVFPYTKYTYDKVLISDKIDFDFSVTYSDVEKFVVTILETPLKFITPEGKVAELISKIYKWGDTAMDVAEFAETLGKMKELYDKYNYETIKEKLEALNDLMENKDVKDTLNKVKEESSLDVELPGLKEAAKAYLGEYNIRLKGTFIIPKEICYVRGDAFSGQDISQAGKFPCSSTNVDVKKLLAKNITDACEEDLTQKPKEEDVSKTPKNDTSQPLTNATTGGTLITPGEQANQTNQTIPQGQQNETTQPEEPDSDKDGIPDKEDNCPEMSNPDQKDSDGDGYGDACDICPKDSENDADGDGVCESEDNCPKLYNRDQKDSDNDGVGDYCDSEPFGASWCGDYASQQGWQDPQGGDPYVLSSGSVSSEECAALANQQGEAVSCNLLCKYAYYKEWTWSINGKVVNRYACCWGYTKYLPCENCPGQEPLCPSVEACASYNPFPS